MFQNMFKTKFKMAAASEELCNVDLQLELEINKDDFLGNGFLKNETEDTKIDFEGIDWDDVDFLLEEESEKDEITLYCAP